MPTEEELKQFGAKPPEEAAPPPEARTAPSELSHGFSPWEMIIGKSSIPKTATFFLCFLEDMYVLYFNGCIEYHISGLVALSHELRTQSKDQQFQDASPMKMVMFHCHISFRMGYIHDRWWFQIFYRFTPKIGGNDPIWRPHMFEMGWFNHQMGWYPHLLRSSRQVKDEGQDLYATDAADAEKQEEEDKDIVF